MLYEFAVKASAKQSDEKWQELFMNFVIATAEYLGCEIGGSTEEFVLDTKEPDQIKADIVAFKFRTILLWLDPLEVHITHKRLEAEDEQEKPPAV